MIVTCNVTTYPYADAHCGKTYDDVTHSTVCPHDELPPKRTLDELKAEFGDSITDPAVRDALDLPTSDT